MAARTGATVDPPPRGPHLRRAVEPAPAPAPAREAVAAAPPPAPAPSTPAAAAPAVAKKRPLVAKKAAPAKKAPAPEATAWVEASGGMCPASHPIKAKLASSIFHAPGQLAYDRTRPTAATATSIAAQDDGLRPAKR